MQYMTSDHAQTMVSDDWVIVSVGWGDYQLVTIINTGPDAEMVTAHINGLKNGKPHKRVRGSRAYTTYDAPSGLRTLQPMGDWESSVCFGGLVQGEVVQMVVAVSGRKDAHFKITMSSLRV